MLPKIPEGSNFYYTGMMDLPPDAYFVFGSNLQGIHGAGAAKTAINYGAVRGQGVGFSGNTYAIPTREYFQGKVLRTMSIEEIRPYVEEFVRLTQTRPGDRWLLTAVGTGYAGIPDEVIAPLFRGVINCYVPVQWRPYLQGNVA